MCYHNSLSAKAAEIEKRYNAKLAAGVEFEPVYHASAFNFPQWPVITNQDKQTIQLHQWGLIPNWVKSTAEAEKFRTMTFNAKSETVFEKASFRQSIGRKRCLVPSTGFYEWQTLNGKKYPYFIYPHYITAVNDPIFSMAGTWETWADWQTGEIFNTFSILTCEANPLVAQIHNIKKRMPVILPQYLEKVWLSDELSRSDILTICKPYPESKMRAHTISKMITEKNINPNQPAVKEKYTYPELQIQTLF